MGRIKVIAILIAVILGAIVILQNTQPVETRFLFARIIMPNAVLLGITLLIGVAIGLLVALTISIRREGPKNRAKRPGGPDKGGD